MPTCLCDTIIVINFTMPSCLNVIAMAQCPAMIHIIQCKLCGVQCHLSQSNLVDYYHVFRIEVTYGYIILPHFNFELQYYCHYFKIGVGKGISNHLFFLALHPHATASF